MDPTITKQYDELLDALRQHSPQIDVDLVDRAFRFAEEAHRGQRRRSGEPFVSHLLGVAKNLVELLQHRIDALVVVGALLHDTVEDTAVTSERLSAEFGPDLAILVDGVTKISHLSFTSPEAHQAENFRKLILAMATDLRVILIKLCDRLHNMRTLSYLSEEKQRLIARETRDVYAPIAHRLGIGKIKWELEDLSLKYLDPKAYREIADKVAGKRNEREGLVEAFRDRIKSELDKIGLVAEVYARPKHFYSIYNKSKRTGIPFEELHDLLGARVITEEKADCYRVLGVVHGLYPPVAERFDDYIATPKSNMYQSLHTTVYGPEHRMVEVQIRSREMHHLAEFGVAAHYSYKEGGTIDHEIAEKLSGIVQAASEGIETASDPGEVMDFLRTSFYQDEVFVFTPKGDLLKLPKGSTGIDFAYAVHTDLGAKVVGAKVNGRFVPLRYQLRNGDTVQVFTSPSAQPSNDWLAVVKSPKAKTKIRQAIRTQRRVDAIGLGRELLEKLFRREGKKIPREKETVLEDAAQGLGYATVENLYVALGSGDVSPRMVFKKLYPPEQADRLRDGLQRIRSRTSFRSGRGIRFGSLDNLMFRVARCCNPIPGEAVVGIITRGRGISVHRMDCPNAFEERVGKDRRVEVNWDVDHQSRFLVRLVIYGMERQGLLSDLANAISNTKTNISRADIETVDSEARGMFIVEVQNAKHLQRVVAAVKKVKGVHDVVREQLPIDGGDHGGADDKQWAG